MIEITKKTIREIALETPAAIPVFEKLKIDYCCGGNKNFLEACETASVSPELLAERISTALDENKDTSANLPMEKSSSELVDYIVEKHHTFTKAEMNRLTVLMNKVCSKHGNKHPNLFELQDTFRLLCDDLSPHMQKEEMVLFPYIQTLQIAKDRDTSLPTPHFGTVKNPIKMMMLEHDTAGDLLKKMRGVSDDYSTPEGACPSFKGLYFGLEELEKDLHVHIHLENNVLFPNALELEQKIREEGQ